MKWESFQENLGKMETTIQRNSNIDWEFIIQTIQGGKCILFLGPELFATNDGEGLYKNLQDYLDVPNNPDVQKYYCNDDLFLFTSHAKKTKTYYRIKNFYSGAFPEAEQLFVKIAEIPFSLIIKVTPDHVLNRVFERMRINHQFYFYWKKKAPDPLFKTPSMKNPVIYNMLGSIDRQESLVLTHNDLFEYFESIFGGGSMPDRLKVLLKEADNYIFLGVPFDKWYMQLLLRIIYIHNDYDFVRYASNQMLDDELKSFVYEQFRIEFIPQKIQEFILELHERCGNAGLLRQPEEKGASPVEELMDLFANDRLEDLLEQFRAFLERRGNGSSDLLDDLLLVTGKYRRFNKRNYQGIIDEKEAMLQSNRIRYELLELLKEAKQLEETT